jgi:hypothetical protein
MSRVRLSCRIELFEDHSVAHFVVTIIPAEIVRALTCCDGPEVLRPAFNVMDIRHILIPSADDEIGKF